MCRKSLILILRCLLYFSCSKRESNITYVSSNVPQITIADVQVPINLAFQGPDTIHLSGKDVKILTEPLISFANSKRVSTLIPAIKEALAPDSVFIGKDEIPDPIITLYRDSVVRAEMPIVFSAKDPYFPPNNSQSFSFFTRQQGLQHDDISCLARDQFSNIWIGTYGAGVIKFDGQSFYQYTDTEGLTQNYILSILVSGKNEIWLGTRAEGAIKFDGRDFKLFTSNNGLIDNRVETIFEDSKGNIWFGTYNGVSKFDGEKFTSLTPAHGLGNEVVYVILEDRKGDIWMGTRGGGISRYDGTHLYNYTSEHGLVDNTIVTGIIDDLGNLWFGSYDKGLSMFDGSNFHNYTTDSGLPNNFIRSVAQDLAGNIWIGSSTDGLGIIRDDILTFFALEHGLINSFVTSFLPDKSGTMWFGTYGGGLGHHQGNRFTHLYESHGLSDGFVRSLLQDKNGDIWLGTNTDGLFKLKEDTLFNYSTAQGLPHPRIGGIAEDRNGAIWLASTGGGIIKLYQDTLTIYDQSNGLPDNFILSVMVDSADNVWFATRSEGVIRYDGNYFFQYNLSHGLSDNNTRQIIEDKMGNIWIGTRSGGVNRFDGSTFVWHNEKSGLPSNNILDIIEDSEGNIWIATNGNGLVKYDGERYFHYTEREGLINDFVYALIQDHEGFIWAGTRMGLSKLISNISPNSILDDRITPTSFPVINFKNYNQNQGYLGLGTNSRAMLLANDSKIWIGANDILTIYDPEGDFADHDPPRVQINFVGLFNENIQWNKLSNRKDTVFKLTNGVFVRNIRFETVENWSGLPVNLSLHHENNYITFRYNGISNSINDNLQYIYKLTGLENQWNSLTRRTEVSYGNLRPGKYVFNVKAVNNDGFWSSEYQYPFEIRPPMSQTPVAYGFYVLIGVALISGLYRYQKKLLQRNQLEKQKELILQQEIAIARQSAEFKQNFLANMSHEIRTPLTGVLGMANLLNQMDLDPKAREYVNDLCKSGESLKETINMILDISKIEAGKLKLKKHSFSLHHLMEESLRLFSPLCKSGVSMESYLDPEIPEIVVSDQQRVSQIIKNFLSNAVKFTESGKIIVKASLEKEGANPAMNDFTVKISVCDTGPGIPFQEQKKLFTPFYQIEHRNKRTHEGTGLGLAICKELSLLLGGQVGLESTPGSGSCFWFTFKNHKESREGSVYRSFEWNDFEKTGERSLNILLVEDNPLIQKVVSLMLGTLGHSVVLASNGEEAINIYAPGSFDLIFMDIQMPVMDGITATALLREKFGKLPPVVGLSANAFEGDRKKYMSQGLDEYITKPIEEKDFVQLLTKLGLQ